jgi:hypothetical protein
MTRIRASLLIVSGLLAASSLVVNAARLQIFIDGDLRTAYDA